MITDPGLDWRGWLSRNRYAPLRYATVAAIVLVVGGLFVQQQMATIEANPAGALGVLDDRKLEVGKPAPDFALEGPDGQLLRLSDFRGKTVVLNFWASWCAPCRAEMPEFQAVYEERHDSADLSVLAIDFLMTDSREAALGFIEEVGATFPIAFDTRRGDVAIRYGVAGLPATFFIDPDGVLRHMNFGPVTGGLLARGVEAADSRGASTAR
jgi:peroxiredoxin